MTCISLDSETFTVLVGWNQGNCIGNTNLVSEYRWDMVLLKVLECEQNKPQLGDKKKGERRLGVGGAAGKYHWTGDKCVRAVS